jgi:hypothetical protein
VVANVSGGVIPQTPIWQMATARSSSFRTVFIIYDITMKACVKSSTQIKCGNHKDQ